MNSRVVYQMSGCEIRVFVDRGRAVIYTLLCGPVIVAEFRSLRGALNYLAQEFTEIIVP
jgi:hypothetical protein